MSNPVWRRWLVLCLAAAVFALVVSQAQWWEAALRFVFPGQAQVLHPRASPATLVLEHLKIVGVSSFLTILFALPLGIWVTRTSGRDFLSLVSDVTAFGQTFPPVAVLALTVPALGFGLMPTVVALFLYGLLPVVHNTVAGLRAVPADTLEAAYGMGMARHQALIRVEVPLALPVILAGVRISVIVNIGTAMVGAVIGAGELGSPVVAGLVQDNLAFVLEGAVPAAVLAVLVDRLIGNVESSLVKGG